MSRMGMRGRLLAHTALAGALVALAFTSAASAQAQTVSFDIPAEPLGASLRDFARESGQQIIFTDDLVAGKSGPAVHGSYAPEEALSRLLGNSGLVMERSPSGSIMVRPKNAEAASNSGAAFNPSMETVVVTGTHIQGETPESSPLTIYTADQIKAQGATTTDQFVRMLPQNFTGFAPSALTAVEGFGNGQDSGGGTAVDLRGLGAGTTLVLLDGHPLAPGFSGTAVDVSLIPLAAIARVEIVTDGASAIYGSDAVGGVVNFISKQDFTGNQTTAGFATATSGGLHQERVEQTSGFNWDSGNIVVSAGWQDQTQLLASERPYSVAAAPLTLIPSDKRWNVFATGQQELDAGVSLYGTALASSRVSFANESQSSPGFSENVLEYPASNYYFVDGGVRGEVWDNLHWDLNASYSKSLTHRFQVQEITDPFELTMDLTSRTNFEQYEFAPTISGTLFSLPGGDLKFSLGGGFDHQHYDSQATQTSAGSPPASSANVLQREIGFAFGELAVPVISPAQAIPGVFRLELNAASRWSHYSDFGSNVSSKFGLSWYPVADLKFRGTYSEFFRAPYLTELDPSGSNYQLNFASDFDAQDAFAAFTGVANPTILFTYGNNAHLQPERGVSRTAGLDFSPSAIPSLKLSATYVHIDYRNRINTPDPEFAGLSDPTVAPFQFIIHPTAAQVANVVNGATLLGNDLPGTPSTPAEIAAATTVIYDNRLQNISSESIDAVDLDAAYGFEVGSGGRVQLDSHIALLPSITQRVIPLSPDTTEVGLVLRPPSMKGRFEAAYSVGGFTANAAVNYVDGFKNDLLPGSPSISSWTTVDIYLAYQFDTSEEYLGGTSVSLSIQNLFDKDPPFVDAPVAGALGLASPIGFDPTNSSPVGRFIGLEISQKW